MTSNYDAPRYEVLKKTSELVTAFFETGVAHCLIAEVCRPTNLWSFTVAVGRKTRVERSRVHRWYRYHRRVSRFPTQPLPELKCRFSRWSADSRELFAAEHLDDPRRTERGAQRNLTRPRSMHGTDPTCARRTWVGAQRVERPFAVALADKRHEATFVGHVHRIEP